MAIKHDNAVIDFLRCRVPFEDAEKKRLRLYLKVGLQYTEIIFDMLEPRWNGNFGPDDQIAFTVLQNCVSIQVKRWLKLFAQPFSILRNSTLHNCGA